MENVPVINMTFRSPAPGADPEVWDRYVKWGREVYRPLLMKVPMLKANDLYWVVRESPDYPFYGSILHYENIEAAENYFKTPESSAIRDEISSWTKRGIVEYFWRVRYELIRSIGSGPVSILREGTPIENAPVIHIEAYSFSPEEGEKYSKWLNDFGFNTFIPLIVKLPGLQKYDCFKCLDAAGMAEARETKYPVHLSILYFENIKAFENYTKSAELVVFQKALRNLFPNMPVYKWYVQYRLVQSLRK